MGLVFDENGDLYEESYERNPKVSYYYFTSKRRGRQIWGKEAEARWGLKVNGYETFLEAARSQGITELLAVEVIQP